MLSESELISDIRAGLEAVTPPAPWLASSVERRLRTVRQANWRTPRAIALRVGLNAVAVLVVISFVIAGVGVFLDMHRSTVSIGPGSGPVIFPTKMVSATTGWAMVDPNQLWRTSDGGRHWLNVTPPVSPDAKSVPTGFFLDDNHAWIGETGGAGPSGSAEYFIAFSTRDGGHTWQVGNQVSLQASSLGMGGPQTFFVNANDGWLLVSGGDLPELASPILYGTHDGGLHWALVSSNAGGFGLTGGRCWGAIAFATPSTGWLTACGESLDDRSELRVTYDGGVTWEIQSMPVSAVKGTSFGTPVFVDALHGFVWLFGSQFSSMLFATSDGGLNWTRRPLPGEAALEVNFVDPSRGWVIAGSFAQLQKHNVFIPTALPLFQTDDGGLTWVQLRTNLLLESSDGRILDIYFVDRSHGFATRVGANGPTELLTTADGGRSWSVIANCTSPLGLQVPSKACPRSKS